MSEQSARPERVWDRLRRNRERNTALFTSAGIRPERAGAVVCPSCGAEESALFWSATRLRGKVVHLLCPICEEARVRYSLGRNQVVDPVFNRHSVGGGLGAVLVLVCAGGLFYFRDTPPVRAVVEDALVVRASAAKTVDRVTDGRFGGRYTVPPPSAGSSRPSSAGGTMGSGARGPVHSRSSSGAPSGFSGRSNASAGALPWSRNGADSAPGARGQAQPAAHAFAFPGDQRDAVEAFAAEIAARYGEAEAAALREVRYDAAAGETRVVIDTTSQAWQRWLEALPGGRRLER